MSVDNLTKGGNIAVREGKFLSAVELYTRAFEAAGTDDAAAAGILTKRSGAYLGLDELQKSLSCLVDCILTDERAFHFVPSTNAKVPRPLAVKLFEMLRAELTESGNIEYFSGSAWHPRDIIVLWAALEMHLRAVGLTAGKLIERVREAQRVDDAANRFFKPQVEHNPRDLGLFALNSVLPVIGDPSTGMTVNTTLKPIPSVFVPHGVDPNSTITQREWEEHEGDLGLMDMLAVTDR